MHIIISIDRLPELGSLGYAPSGYSQPLTLPLVAFKATIHMLSYYYIIVEHA